MMVVYTYSEARQNFASVLDKAVQEGEVRVKRKDGQVFVIRLVDSDDSPLNVEGIDLGLTAEEILEFIQEDRRLSKDAAKSGLEAIAPSGFAFASSLIRRIRQFQAHSM
jgi:hypothetical protein